MMTDDGRYIVEAIGSTRSSVAGWKQWGEGGGFDNLDHAIETAAYLRSQDWQAVRIVDRQMGETVHHGRPPTR
ncbi:MAG: hypothetical protein OXK82_12960 [Deltaproteobacteria bacterium]|nr:hypothetical protein [bacterium]MDE0344052.1 hypothetical protein [Deltaproteobacteria bacterium]